jgi:hypothetical protein
MTFITWHADVAQLSYCIGNTTKPQSLLSIPALQILKSRRSLVNSGRINRRRRRTGGRHLRKKRKYAISNSIQLIAINPNATGVVAANLIEPALLARKGSARSVEEEQF